MFLAVKDGIAEYTTSGALENATLVSPGDDGDHEGLALSGSDLFLTDYSSNIVGEYTTSGAIVNANLISGLDAPFGIAIADVPEPASLSLLLLGGVLRINRRRRLA